MKILAVDTSNKIASVALIENNKIINEKFSEDQKTHSEKVLPLIDELLNESGITIKEIDEFVVCTGPGSFTGIRIGVSLIKGIAQGIRKKVIGVTALEGLVNKVEGNVCAIIDARHDNVYAQYRINEKYNEAECMNIDELFDLLPDEDIMFIGDAVTVHKEKIIQKGYKVNEDIKIQSASDLVMYALKNSLESLNPSEVNPIYLRKAQPERTI